MFCSNCGKCLPEGAIFCSDCGTAAVASQSACEQQHNSAQKINNGVQMGFSSKVNDPSLKATLKKGGKFTAIFAVMLILLPIAVTFFIGISGEDFSAMPIGFAVSAVLLIFNLVSFAKKKSAKQWDGVVTDKHSREKHSRSTKDNASNTYTEYTITLREDSGKTRKITEGTPYNSAHPYYEYLSIGDKVRFHPQFNNFYEKYDKTHDTYLYCAICSRENDITQDRCSACNALLIK